MFHNRSLFWQFNVHFLGFAGSLALFLGLLSYAGADHFGAYLIGQQVQPVMTALITMEHRWRDGPDREYSDGEIERLADSVGADFLVGKQVPSKWQRRAPGLYLDGDQFVYLERDQEATYALRGSSRAMKNFLRDIAALLLTGGILGLLGATAMAWWLARHLAAPLEALAQAIGHAPPGDIEVPPALNQRRDEIGQVARAIQRHQEVVREYWQREAAFTGDVSHELRTPLAVLATSLELISCRAQDPALRPFLERMELTVGEMEGTVHALLAMARKAPATMQLLDMAALVRRQLHRLEHAGRCPQGSEMAGSGHAWGQPDLAATAVANILANACAHASDGHLRVDLSETSLEVRNRGQWRPPATGALRLGLGIAGRCCEKMGWRLTVSPDGDEVVATVQWPRGG